jgi:nucleoside-diphosphate-sugar epimerase
MILQPGFGADESIPFECDLDISKARRHLQYKPKYDPEEARSLVREAMKSLVLVRRKQLGFS